MPRTSGGAATAAWVGVLIHTCVPALAQDAPDVSVRVLRGGDQGELAEQVDAAVLASLRSAAGIAEPRIAPIPLAEVRLSVGCSDDQRECLTAIASVLEVDALVVRRLEGSHLSLVWFDASAVDDPTQSAGSLGEDVERDVDTLVRALFGLPPAPVIAASDTTGAGTSAPASEGGVGPLTWISLGVGVAAVAMGGVLRLMANSSYDDYVDVDVQTREDADHARSLLDEARTRGLVSTILFATGGALVALGATLLVLDLTGSDEGPQVGVAPLPGGGALVLRGPVGRP